MPNKNTFTKILAFLGTLLVWLPILELLLLSAVRLIQDSSLLSAVRLIPDSLLPSAVLFPVALAGWGLLIWAALRARAQRVIILISLPIAIPALAAGLLLSFMIGLSSGELDPTGFWWDLGSVMLGIYSLTLVITGVGGFLLLLNLFRPAT